MADQSWGHVRQFIGCSQLPPLSFDRITMLGRYAFILPVGTARGDLKPLRDPIAASHDEG